MDKELAELVGIFVGDGCLSRYFSKYDNRWKSVILFTGNLDSDREYYERVLKPIVMKKFNVKGYVYFRKSDNTVRYSIFCKKMISYLLGLGFKFGPKYNSCTIPTKIKSKDLEIAFLRGIFNSDGTVYRRYTKRYKNHPMFYGNYAVVQFKMKSRMLIEGINEMLQSNGFKINRITRTGRYSLIRITDQIQVKRFFNEIATDHPYHMKRYTDIANN